MRILMKNELERAFRNKWFYATLLICLLAVIYDTFTEVIPVRNAMDIYIATDGYPIPNLYNRWMELQSGRAVSWLLHLIFPLLVCIPYSISIYSDVETRYVYSIISRIDKKKYFLSKLFTQFLVGFAVVMFTMIISFMITASILPVGTPIAGLQYMPANTEVFGKAFYRHPLLMSVIVMILQSVMFALIGCLSYTFAYLLRNGVMVVVSAFTIYFFESVVAPLIQVENPMLGCSYLFQLTYSSVGVFLFELFIILITVIMTYFLRAKKRDEL